MHNAHFLPELRGYLQTQTVLSALVSGEACAVDSIRTHFLRISDFTVRKLPPLIPSSAILKFARQSGRDGRGDTAGFRITEIPALDSVAVPNRSMSERRRTDRAPRACRRVAAHLPG